MAIGTSVVSQSHTPNQANPLGWVEYFHGISLNLKRRCNGYLSIGTSTHQASEGWFPRRLSPVPLREETAFTIESSFTCHGDKEVSPSWSLGNKFLCIHFFCAHHIHSFSVHTVFISSVSFTHFFWARCIHFFCAYGIHFCAHCIHFFGAHHIYFLSAHLFISSVHSAFIHFFSAHYIYFFCAHLWEHHPLSEAFVISSVRSVYLLDGSQDFHP